MTVSASAAPSSIGSDFGATAAPSSRPGFGVTTAGGYADEVTPDAPSTTDPTLPGDYVDEVRRVFAPLSTSVAADADSVRTGEICTLLEPGSHGSDSHVHDWRCVSYSPLEPHQQAVLRSQ